MRVQTESTSHLPVFVVFCVSLLFCGCGSEPDAKTELENAVAVMETAPPPAPVAPMPPAQPRPQYQQQVPRQVQPVAPPPAQQMNQAMAAYQAGNLGDAVTRLQRLRATPAMSPQQRIALNDAMAAVMTEIYTLAEQGDARAIQAVKQYELMQTQGR